MADIKKLDRVLHQKMGYFGHLMRSKVIFITQQGHDFIFIDKLYGDQQKQTDFTT